MDKADMRNPELYEALLERKVVQLRDELRVLHANTDQIMAAGIETEEDLRNELHELRTKLDNYNAPGAVIKMDNPDLMTSLKDHNSLRAMLNDKNLRLAIYETFRHRLETLLMRDNKTYKEVQDILQELDNNLNDLKPAGENNEK